MNQIFHCMTYPNNQFCIALLRSHQGWGIWVFPWSCPWWFARCRRRPPWIPSDPDNRTTLISYKLTVEYYWTFNLPSYPCESIFVKDPSMTLTFIVHVFLRESDFFQFFCVCTWLSFIFKSMFFSMKFSRSSRTRSRCRFFTALCKQVSPSLSWGMSNAAVSLWQSILYIYLGPLLK